MKNQEDVAMEGALLSLTTWWMDHSRLHTEDRGSSGLASWLCREDEWRRRGGGVFIKYLKGSPDLL